MKKWITALLSLMLVVSLSFQEVNAASLKITSFKTSSYGYVNSSVKLSVKASGGTGTKKYKYYYKLGKKTTTIKNYSTSKSVSFKPKKAGTYTLYVAVRDKKKTVTKSKKVTVYSNVSGKISLSNYVNKKYVTSNYVKTKSTVKISASGSGGKGTKKYKYYYKYNGKTTTIKGYTTKKSVTFKPSKAGTYKMYVTVKDANNKTKTVSKTLYVYTSSLSSTITCNGNVVDEKTPYEVSLGEQVKITMNAEGGVKNYQFKFVDVDKKLDFDSNYGQYSNNNELKFYATKEGKFKIQAYVKDASGHDNSKVIYINISLKKDLKVEDCIASSDGKPVKLEYTTNFKFRKRGCSIDNPEICEVELVPGSRDINIIGKEKGTTKITLYLSYNTDLVFIDNKIMPEVLNNNDVIYYTFNVTVE